jgi:predicted PurR-regulated permease PerM
MDNPNNNFNRDPKDLIEAWLPHIIIFSLLICSVVLLYTILGPVLPSLLMAAALTSLSMPVYFFPVYNCVKKLFPSLPETILRKICAFLAMGLMALSVIIPIVLLIYSITGSLQGAESMLKSLIDKNMTAFEDMINVIMAQIKVYKELYPSLPIEPEFVSKYLRSTFLEIIDFQTTLMSFLFKGTGNLAAQLVLCVIAMIFFYAEGAILVRTILKATPLAGEKSELLISTFRRVVLRLLTDSIAISLLTGILLGLWVGLFTGFNIIVLIFISSFICLLPMLGATIIWFPAFMLLLNQGKVFSAISLAVMCLLSLLFVGWIRKYKVSKLYEYRPVTSFLLFMSLVGGVITFGLKGLILGPMTVVLVNVLGVYWHSIYNQRKAD